MPKITAFNKAINTIEVAGVFWIGRQLTTRQVEDSRVKEVKNHPLLEVQDSGSKTKNDNPKDDDKKS